MILKVKTRNYGYKKKITCFLLRYKLTLLGLNLAILIAVLSNIFDLDPFDRLVSLFSSVEKYEIDEIFIGALVFLVFFMAELILWHRNQKIEIEKVKIYRAMIASSHHILNNFLNQMLIFKMTAEETPGFDQDILKLYDEIIKDAKQQIEALSSIGKISQEAIEESIKPRPRGQISGQSDTVDNTCCPSS